MTIVCLLNLLTWTSLRAFLPNCLYVDNSISYPDRAPKHLQFQSVAASHANERSTRGNPSAWGTSGPPDGDEFYGEPTATGATWAATNGNAIEQ